MQLKEVIQQVGAAEHFVWLEVRDVIMPANGEVKKKKENIKENPMAKCKKKNC